MKIFQLSGAILTLCVVGVVLGTSCSSENRDNNLGGCLQGMKEMLVNTNLYWFGDSYANTCPNGPADGIECTNTSPGVGKSIESRLLGNGYDESLFTKFLKVKFTSYPGDYTGCGKTFRYTETSTFDVDPTSSLVLKPWFTRQLPEMTWDSTSGEYYSLYVYDVGYYFTHAVYINIVGNSIPTSGPNAIFPYFGPLTSTAVHNVYAFLLFKQNGYLNPATAQEWYNSAHVPNSFASSSHVPGFINTLGMTGPVGMNWIVVTGDEYAAQTSYDRGFRVTCPIFIGQALDRMPAYIFLPRPAQLTVNMDIEFHVEELNFEACCFPYTESARTLTLNPLKNELLQTSATRSGLRQTFTFEKVGFVNAAKDFTGDMYTLIAFDPIEIVSSVGSISHPLLHQMQINIRNGDFTTGEEVIPWTGPFPPNDEPHYYFFLLYKHTVPVTRTLMTSYAADCDFQFSGRCLYDINKAVRENSFTLVGASWFRAQRDLYVRYRKLDSDANNTEVVCETQAGYPASCNPSSGRSIYVSDMFVVVVSLGLLILCTL